MPTEIDLEKNLQLFARWESVVPYFSRNERGNNDPYFRIIKPLIARLEQHERLEVVNIGDHPYNYYAFFCHRKGERLGKTKGVMTYMSLLAPVAVVARRAISRFEDGFSYSPVELDEVFHPDEARNVVEQVVVQQIRSTDYDLLIKEDMDKLLPEHIKIKHKSVPDKRYFHAIFDWDENA